MTNYSPKTTVVTIHQLRKEPSMNIEVEVRSVYGVPTIYPSNETARVLAEIAGTKTLTPRVLELARDLGLKVVDKTQAPSILERFKEAA
jgi:hypothetical protein